MGRFLCIALLLALVGRGVGAASIIDQDFESNMLPWIDTSSGQMSWLAELYNDEHEAEPAPQPEAGVGILRLHKSAPGSSGVAILRSPFVEVRPGDEFAFSFWIRSSVVRGNNIEVYWRNNTNEELLVSLALFSTPINFQWRRIGIPLPVTQPTQTTFVIYGTSGPNDIDDAAIDDIVLGPPVGTTLGPSTTNPTSTTVQPPTTTVAPSACPAFLNNDARLPCRVRFVDNSTYVCYCHSRFQETRETANIICRDAAFELATLESASQDNAILDIISSSGELCQTCLYWTSGVWNSTQSRYEWQTTGQPLTYTNWFQTQPDLSVDGACIVMNYVGNWGDDDAALRRNFVCQLKL